MKNVISGVSIILGLSIQAIIGSNIFAIFLMIYGLLMFEYTPSKWTDLKYRKELVEIQLLEQKLKKVK